MRRSGAHTHPADRDRTRRPPCNASQRGPIPAEIPTEAFPKCRAWPTGCAGIARRASCRRHYRCLLNVILDMRRQNDSNRAALSTPFSILRHIRNESRSSGNRWSTLREHNARHFGNASSTHQEQANDRDSHDSKAFTAGIRRLTI